MIRSRRLNNAPLNCFDKLSKCYCSPLVRLVEDVVGDILNVIRGETLTECRHGAVAIGRLLDDRLNRVLAIGLEGLLLDLLLRHDAVVAVSMTSSAIGCEDARSILQIGGQRRAAAKHGGEQAERSTECQRAEGTARLGVGL